MGGTGQYMGCEGKGRKGTGEGEGKEREGLQPLEFNSWCCHCMKGVRASASHLIWIPIS